MVEYSHFQAELKFQRIRTAIQGKPFEKNVHSAMFCVNSLAKDSNVLRLVNKIKYCRVEKYKLRIWSTWRLLVCQNLCSVSNVVLCKYHQKGCVMSQFRDLWLVSLNQSAFSLVETVSVAVYFPIPDHHFAHRVSTRFWHFLTFLEIWEEQFTIFLSKCRTWAPKFLSNGWGEVFSFLCKSFEVASVYWINMFEICN